MKVEAIKTKIVKPGDNLLTVLDQSIETLEEGSVVVITSKIISICQNAIVSSCVVDKESLIFSESDRIFVKKSPCGMHLTIKDGILIANAGIDESNGNGNYILWPREIEKTMRQVLAHLRTRFQIEKIGVVVTDSKTTPLRRGTTGVGIAFDGSLPRYFRLVSVVDRTTKY